MEREVERIKIRTDQGNIHEVEKSLTSIVLGNIYQQIDTQEIIPLQKVPGQILIKIIEFCDHYRLEEFKKIQKPLKSANLYDVTDRWAAEFIDIQYDKIFLILQSANYLGIQPILDLCSAKIASLIKYKTLEEIKRTFNIQNNFTPQEIQEVRIENRWAEIDQSKQ